MSDVAIRVENLSKLYKIGAIRDRHDTLRDHLVHGLNTLIGRNGHQRVQIASHAAESLTGDCIWALKDVSFDIKQGEVVGFIGRNGAGKSTLLKILSQITEPTKGRAEIYGRIGSLLEVGTGFQGELTGRENVYLNGAILGMRKSEIDQRFDEIVAFSEIEQFIDTPVKRYSSGMYVRLAFSVAAHLDPEILILDEVLAVGDAGFQKKCLRKIDEASKGGRTVLFVSHNMQAVNSLCSRALLLDGGKVEKSGDVASVVRGYLAACTNETLSEQIDQLWKDQESAPGNDKIRLRRIKIVPNTDEGIIDIASPFRIEIDYWNLSPQDALLINLCFHSHDGVFAFETVSSSDPEWHGRPVSPGLFRSVCHMPACLMNDGLYTVGISFFGCLGPLYKQSKVAVFTLYDMEPRKLHFYGKFGGVVRPRLKWETTLLGDSHTCNSDNSHQGRNLVDT